MAHRQGRPHGQIRLLGPNGTKELDSFRCPHCGGIFTVEKKKAPPGSCWNRCGGAFICQGCIGKPCTPFLEAIELAERRDRLRRQIAGDYR